MDHFFNNPQINAVENALLILSDEEGRTDTLTYLSEGPYSSSLEGKAEREHMLSVQAFMPKPAVIHSFSISYQPESLIRKEDHYVTLHKLDPLEKEEAFTNGWFGLMIAFSKMAPFLAILQPST